MLLWNTCITAYIILLMKWRNLTAHNLLIKVHMKSSLLLFWVTIVHVKKHMKSIYQYFFMLIGTEIRERWWKCTNQFWGWRLVVHIHIVITCIVKTFQNTLPHLKFHKAVSVAASNILIVLNLEHLTHLCCLISYINNSNSIFYKLLQLYAHIENFYGIFVEF